MTGVVIFSSFSNTIGGTTTAARNVISGNVGEGIFIGFSGSTTAPALDVVLGNYIGTDATGMNALGNTLSGVLLQDSFGVTIGGTTTGAGNLISGNGDGTQPGLSISGASQDNLAEGNLIGTDLTGLAPLGGSTAHSNSQGIVLSDAGNETIGGTAQGAGNTIAFNASTGIYIIPGTIPYNGTQIVGNTINSNGGDGIKLQTSAGDVVATLIQTNVIMDNSGNGVWVDGPSNSSISHNTISGNANDGVEVSLGTGNSILTNSIFNNTNLAIELTGNGNNNQPSPVLTSATVSAAGNTTIAGTLQAAANMLYHLEFFSSPSSPLPRLRRGQDVPRRDGERPDQQFGICEYQRDGPRRRRGQPVLDRHRDEAGHQRHVPGLEDEPQPPRDPDRFARAGEPDSEPHLHDHSRQPRRLADAWSHAHRHSPRRRHLPLGHRGRHPGGQRGDLPDRGLEPWRQRGLHHRRPRRYRGHDQ